MGCASALVLAKAGVRVVVLERSVPGAEASSAAAGILGAQVEAEKGDAFFELARMSRERYPVWAEDLRAATGIDVGYRRCGVLRVALGKKMGDDFAHDVAWQTAMGLTVESVDAMRLSSLEPKLSPTASCGVLFADDGRIDPPRLLKALHIAAVQAGAEFRSGTYVRGVVSEGGAVRGVGLEDGARIAAEWVVIAAGSWSTLVAGVPLQASAVRPARGQIVELQSREPELAHVVFGPGCYLVPREDGRMLVGSTLEFVGYRREVTARAVRDLLGAAIDLVPSLADATLGRTWSNFRPYAERGMPLIGPSEIRGLVLATGHHRNGILLAPITAEIVRAVVLGEKPPVDLAPFSAAS